MVPINEVKSSNNYSHSVQCNVDVSSVAVLMQDVYVSFGKVRYSVLLPSFLTLLLDCKFNLFLFYLVLLGLHESINNGIGTIGE